MSDPRQGRIGAAMRYVGPLAHRAGWTFADQAFSSISNFGVTIFVARVSNARGFGAFAIAYTTYMFVLGLSEAVASDPLIIRYSARTPDTLSDPIRSSTGLSLANGIVAGVSCIVIGLAFGGVVGSALIGLGLVLPALTLQDCWRFVFFASGDPRSAALNDLAWCIGQFAAFGGLLLWVPHPSVFALVVAWGIGAWIAALFGILQARLIPDPRQASRWLRDHRDLALSLVADDLLMTLGLQVTLYVVAIFAGLDQAGGLRGAQAIIGPLNVVIMASRIFAVPELVRIKHADYERTRSATRALAGGLITLAVLYGIGVSLLPSSIGHALLGASWKVTRPVLPFYAAIFVSRAATLPAVFGLRALDAPKHLVAARAKSAVPMLLGGVAAAALGSAVGAAAGLAAGGWLGVVIWWQAFGRAFRDRRPTAADPRALDDQADDDQAEAARELARPGATTFGNGVDL